MVSYCMEKIRYTLLTLSILMFSCAGTPEDLELDLAEGSEVEIEDLEDKASNSANTNYYVVTRRDMRRCLSPLCGGYFVKKVNQQRTRCADGTLQNECYVSDISLSGLRLSDQEEADFQSSLAEGKALIKARSYRYTFRRTRLGRLKASEGWLGATGSTPDGTFFRVADNGVRCITTPCYSTTAYGLNGADDYNVLRTHLENTTIPADETSLFLGQTAMATREGVMVVGYIYTPRCLPNSIDCGPGIGAQEFYLRVKRREGESCGGFRATPAPCNQNQFCQWEAEDICGAADAPGTCQYRPEICTEEFNPVCGCDGQTYGNPCNANGAGTSVAQLGECRR